MEKRKIRAQEIVEDVQVGMGDTVPMEQYGRTAKQLEGVLRTLVDLDLITHMQLYEWTPLSDTQITKAFVEAKRAITELD